MTRAGKITRITMATGLETSDPDTLKAERFDAVVTVGRMLGYGTTHGVFSQTMRDICDAARHCGPELAKLIQECQRRQALAERLE